MGFEVYDDFSFSFLNVDEFKFRMPMCWNLMEIQRNGAQIGIVWEMSFQVCFFLLIIFIFQNIHKTSITQKNGEVKSIKKTKNDRIVLVFNSILQEKYHFLSYTIEHSNEERQNTNKENKLEQNIQKKESIGGKEKWN